MKLCAACIKQLQSPDGTICLSCYREVRRRAEVRDGEAWPQFWNPRPGEAICVPGMTGMGKSFLQKEWMRFLMAQGVPVFCWDAMREASELGIEREDTQRGPLLTQVTASDVEYDPETNLRVVPRGAEAQAIAMVPDREYPTRSERAEDFCKAMGVFLRGKPRGRVVLFLTEVGLLEGETDAEEMLGEIATTWRKEGVAAVFDVQSISMVPDRARRQLQTILAFKQVDPNDRRRLTELVSRRYADAVRALPPHHCLLADRLNPEEWDEETADEAAEDAA